MAEIQPFMGWRYNQNLHIDTLISPLVNKDIDESIYNNPINSIHLSQPKNQDYNDAKSVLENWKHKNILIQDSKPCIYVYYQEFKIYNESNDSYENISRKGFICNVRISEWNENIILRHENTIPFGVENRLSLLDSLKINTSPTHGIYDDHDLTLDKYMDESIKNPVYDSIDYQGVRDKMSIIDDPVIIEKFQSTLKNKKVIIADGHHRYESSLIYLQKMKESDNYNPDKLYNFHMMYLSNSDDEGLKIFPTHRIIKNIENFNKNDFLTDLEKYFIISQLESRCCINQRLENLEYSFGLIFDDSSFLLRLKNEYLYKIEWDLPDEVKDLDVTILHYYILYKILGINQEEQRVTDKIEYKVDFNRCYENILTSESQAAIITKYVSIDEIEAVCYSGNIMPQKSTYFYPKVICGFVFSEIE